MNTKGGEKGKNADFQNLGGFSQSTSICAKMSKTVPALEKPTAWWGETQMKMDPEAV